MKRLKNSSDLYKWILSEFPNADFDTGEITQQVIIYTGIQILDDGTLEALEEPGGERDGFGRYKKA